MDSPATTIDSIATEIASEIKTAINAVMKRAGAILPAKVKLNFDTSGKRGGNPEWKKTNFKWLVQRKSFPGGPTTLMELHQKRRERGDKQLLTADQQAYYKSARPLFDTGALRNSIVVLERSQAGLAAAQIIIGSALPYAEQNDQGIPGKVHARPFNHLVPEDLIAIDTIVSEEFAR